MRPRTIVYTGKGGVGKTSVAAATARACAQAGQRTLLLSTDAAHSLADVLGTPVGPSPTAIDDGLWAQEVQAQDALERSWSAIRGWLGELLVRRGVNRISAEELTVPPGGEELFALLELRRQADEGGWDVLVVDCAPSAETLRLLSFPDVARWWLERVFPHEEQILATVGPLARGLLDVPGPTPGALADVRRLMEGLVALDDLLRDSGRVSVRLVTTPDRLVVAEAMRTFTYLNLYGYLTDAVIANRVFPAALDGTYLGPWRASQLEQLERLEDAFAPVGVRRAPLLEAEVCGPELLDRLAGELFAPGEAGALLHPELTQQLRVDPARAELTLALPFAQRGELSLKKIGAEVVVRVGDRKRIVVLPSSLAGHRARSAQLRDGELRVVFARAGQEADGARA